LHGHLAQEVGEAVMVPEPGFLRFALVISRMATLINFDEVSDFDACCIKLLILYL
jgi:hypothetical protein